MTTILRSIALILAQSIADGDTHWWIKGMRRASRMKDAETVAWYRRQIERDPAEEAGNRAARQIVLRVT